MIVHRIRMVNHLGIHIMIHTVAHHGIHITIRIIIHTVAHHGIHIMIRIIIHMVAHHGIHTTIRIMIHTLAYHQIHTTIRIMIHTLAQAGIHMVHHLVIVDQIRTKENSGTIMVAATAQNIEAKNKNDSPGNVRGRFQSQFISETKYSKTKIDCCFINSQIL